MRTLMLLPWLLLAAPGCDALGGEKADEDGKAGEDGEDGEDGQAPKGDGETPEDGDAAEASKAAEVRTFDEDLKKRGCELLTADMVAEAFDVPADDLKQMKIMGCSYHWEGDDGEVVDAAIRFIRVHDDVEQARRWFGNMTKDQSAEEIRAAMDEVKKRAKEKGALEGSTKEKTADAIGDAITDSTAEGVSFEKVPGIGDDAAASKENGKLYVLLGNATFDIEAYKGKPYTPPPMNPSDTKGQVKAMQEWAKETAPEHKEAAIAVAKLVVPRM